MEIFGASAAGRICAAVLFFVEGYGIIFAFPKKGGAFVKHPKKLALLLCVLLLVGVAALALLPASAPGQSEPGKVHVVLSEILPSNLTHPAPDGGCYDFIEIHNRSDRDVDISGYILSDRPDRIGYTFPEGTILPAGGYGLCWCLKDTDNETMGNFGISRTGGETIYLYTGTNELLDSIQLPLLPDNCSLSRTELGWEEAAYVTPGFANTDGGYAEYLASRGMASNSVVISEVMTGAASVSIDGSVDVCDWVELYNPGSTAVSLTGSYLTDDPEEPLKWRIDSELTIAPGGFALIPCTGSDAAGEADFALSRSGCTVLLSGPLGNLLSRVDCPRLESDESWALLDGEFAASSMPTPGFENSQAGYEAWLLALGLWEQKIVISEIMTANRCTLADASGRFPDWVELYNAGTQEVSLSSFFLSDDPEERGMFRLPEQTLAPGEYALIRCGGSDAAEGDASFALSSGGCTVLLSGSAGNVVSQVTCPALEADCSYALQPDGSFESGYAVSPGYPNTEAGALAFAASRIPTGLIISEVMPSNDKYLLQSDGEYYDWVELYNASGEAVELSDYCLSNDCDDLSAFPLPRKLLQSGERVVIICSGTEVPGRYIHAPFTLSREECRVYLTHRETGLSDWLLALDVPYRRSAGRAEGQGGCLYFTIPTPGAANASGVARVSDPPQALTAEGVYSGITSLTVELSGDAIRYTTDGSLPTADSRIYDGPITLTGTAVIRAASFPEGKLPSKAVTLCYILGQAHTLPVLSLTADPGELFAAGSGIYANSLQDVEIGGNLKLFEENGSFSLDCGVELYGSSSLQLDKKSLQIHFRSRYGADYLGYPVFGDEGPMVFDELLLQAGQEHGRSLFRDELLTSLAHSFSDSVPAQRYKFTVLYINGEYWGIYALKESFGSTFYSENFGVSEESVEMLRWPAPYLSEVYHLTAYCAEQDMTQSEHYAYMLERLDVDSLVDWMVLQGYTGNPDIEDNLRLFRSVENGNRWQFAFYDQDGGFLYHQELANLFAGAENLDYQKLTRGMIRNPAFRERFLTRMAEAKAGALKDEAVLAEIDRLEALLLPEMTRERQRWGGSVESWQADVQRLRRFIGDGDHWDMILKNLQTYLGMTEAEKTQYFS